MGDGGGAPDALSGQAADVENIAAELQAALATLAAREQELQQREHAMEQKSRRLEQKTRAAARAEAGPNQEQLTAERTQLDALRRQLIVDGTRLRQERDQLEWQGDRLRRRFEKWRARIQGQRAALRQRGAALEAQEQELAKRGAQAEQQAAQIAAERQQLERRQQEVHQTASEVETRGQKLSEQRRKLEERAQTAGERERQLARQTAELEARRRALRDEQAKAAEATQRLEKSEQQLQRGLAALDAGRQQLAQAEAELAQRRAATDEAARRTADAERAAQQHRDEALALREQSEARDAETRQAGLVLEVERQEAESRHAALERAEHAFDALRAEREANFTRVRHMLADRAAQLALAQRALLAAPRRWWLRSTALATAAALGAAWLWLGQHPPLFRATEELWIRSESPTSLPADGRASWAAGVLAEHSRGWLDARLLEGEQVSDEVRRAWAGASASGRATMAADEAQMVLRLSVVGLRAEAAEELARAATTAYARRVNSVAEDARLPRYYRDFLLWRDELQGTLDESRRRQTADQAALAELPQPEQRAQVVADADRLQAEVGIVGTTLTEQRATLATLLSAGAPPGAVDPNELEETLRQDSIYGEDQRELLAAGLKYRTELTVALLMATEPLKAMKQALAAYAGAVAEQRGLKPPAAVVQALEGCAGEVSAADERLATFVDQWRVWADAVQHAELARDGAEAAILELVQRQNEAAQAAHQFALDAQKSVANDSARLEQLSAGSGGTREAVVAAVLRGHHTGWKAAVEKLGAAADRTALTGNVELETLDRQLRGLRTRLEQRRELVHERLQLEASRVAQERYAARLAETRGQVEELKRRREKLVSGLLGTLQQVRELDEAVRRHEELIGRLKYTTAQIARLESELATLEEKLADARRLGPKPDRVEVGRSMVAEVPQARRRDAAIVGLGTAAATWVVCVLMLIKLPRRAAHDELARLLAAAGPGDPQDTSPAT